VSERRPRIVCTVARILSAEAPTPMIGWRDGMRLNRAGECTPVRP